MNYHTDTTSGLFMTTPEKNTPAKINNKGRTPGVNFPIIGISASAGGLVGFDLFFSHIPADSGMAFSPVPHPGPAPAGMRSAIPRQNMTTPVHEAKDPAERVVCVILQGRGPCC